LKKDLTESVERKAVLLLKKSSFSEEVCKQLRPQGSRPPRLYGLPKMHKQGVPLRPIVSTIGAPTYRLAKHLAGLLGSHIGSSPHHVRNSTECVHTLGSLHVGLQDIMVSFDVVSLFTRVPIGETISLLSRHFEEDILTLFRHVLTSSYFRIAGQFYEQIDGMAMGSPLSSVIANFYMEVFEEMALDRAPHKPLCWFRYVDDTFVIWPHGPDRLRDFLDHLNTVHQSIQFTMETERDGHLPFLALRRCNTHRICRDGGSTSRVDMGNTTSATTSEHHPIHGFIHSILLIVKRYVIMLQQESTEFITITAEQILT
jgi:hypothetical protein